MGMTVTIKTKGKHPMQFIRDVDKRIHFEFQSFLADIGEQCATKMRENIRTSKKRNNNIEGELEKSIQSEILNYTGGIHLGIGNLNKAPIYYSIINNGGYIPPTTNKVVPLGSFNGAKPDSSKSGGTWNMNGDIYTFIDKKTPKKPIQPFRYIEYGETLLRNAIKREMKKLNKIIKRESRI